MSGLHVAINVWVSRNEDETRCVLNCSCRKRPAVNVYVCMYEPDHVNEFADGGRWEEMAGSGLREEHTRGDRKHTVDGYKIGL